MRKYITKILFTILFLLMVCTSSFGATPPLQPFQGGTGQNSSDWDGFPYVTSGSWGTTTVNQSPFSTSSIGTYLTNTSSDLIIGSDATATAPLWFKDSSGDLVITGNFTSADGFLTTVDISDDTNLATSTGISLIDDTLGLILGEIDHDSLLNFLANEHLDWTQDLGATNIHAGNYTDTNTTYSATGTLLDLTGTVFSVNEGTLTDTKLCIYSSGTGLVCNTTDSSTNWDTAYTDRLKWDGGSTGLNASTGRTSLGLGTMALESNAGTTTIDTVGTLTTAGGNISLWTNDSSYATTGYTGWEIGTSTDMVAGTGLSFSDNTLNWSSTGLTWAGNAIGNTVGGTGQDSSSWNGLLKVSSGTWSTTSLTFTGDITGSGTTSITTTIGADKIHDTMIDWGTGASQVSLEDIPSSFTNGSILFSTSSGAVSQNNANFFWDNGNNRLGVGTTTPDYALDVEGSIRTDTNFYGDNWISASGNSMNIQPTGDEDDFFSFKTPADRPTIKREGGKYIYIESSNVNDAGLSFRKDADHSGTLNYYKDEDQFGLTSKDPLVFKACGDYDDYVRICNTNNTPELYVASSTAFKINAGGSNNLLLNHSGGNVAIGTTTATYTLSLETGKTLGIGTTQWNSGDEIDGTKIKDADYGDISVSAGGAWSIDSGLNLTFGNVTTTNLTVTNAFNLNGTVGTNIDMNNDLILNIGNAGTDFIAGGGLTLAGTLTANGAFTANSTSTFAGLTTSANIVMGDNSITGIDTLTFTDTAGTIAGIANGNLLDKTATEAISGIYNHSKAVNITIADADNDTGLYVVNNNVTNNPRGVQITNAGTNAGLYLDQNGNGRAIQVDSIATSQSGIYSVGSGIYTGTGYNSFISFWLTNTGSTGNLSSFQNDGTGHGIFLDQDGNGTALFIDSEATTTVGIDADFQNVSGDLIQLSVGGSERFAVDYTGQGAFAGDSVTIATAQSPASNAACTVGEIAWDASYIYCCTASGVWKRAALTGGY